MDESNADIDVPVIFTPTIPRGDQIVSILPQLSANDVFKILSHDPDPDFAWDWVTHNRLLVKRGIYPLEPVNGITIEQARAEMRIFGHGPDGFQKAHDEGRVIVWGRALEDREFIKIIPCSVADSCSGQVPVGET